MGMTDFAQLERIAAEVAEEWGLKLGGAFALSRHSYVVSAGDDAVLKIRSADDDESDQEVDALALWGGEGAVRLLRSDPERRVLLIERACPGTDLAELPDDEATAIALTVACKLWRPVDAPFRWIGDWVPHWLKQVEGSQQPGHQLLPRARALYDGLNVGRSILVHGDFHHHNILKAGDRYLTIDPKPMRGEPEFDVFSFIRNPLSYRISLATTERRLAAFAAVGLDEERMRAWSVIRGAYLGADEDEVEVLRALI